MKNIQSAQARNFVKKLPKPDNIDWKDILSGQDEESISMTKSLLTFDPDDRATCEEALKHPYMATLHCPEDEPTGKALEKSDFGFESLNLEAEEYREYILDEAEFHKKREVLDRERREVEQMMDKASISDDKTHK